MIASQSRRLFSSVVRDFPAAEILTAFEQFRTRQGPHSVGATHETVFAMTVYKTQGSEFDAVSILLTGLWPVLYYWI